MLHPRLITGLLAVVLSMSFLLAAAKADNKRRPTLKGYTGQILAQPNAIDPTPASYTIGGLRTNQYLNVVRAKVAIEAYMSTVSGLSKEPTDKTIDALNRQMEQIEAKTRLPDLDIPDFVYVGTATLRPSLALSDPTVSALSFEVGSYLDGWDVGLGYSSSSEEFLGVAGRWNRTHELQQFASDLRQLEALVREMRLHRPRDRGVQMTNISGAQVKSRSPLTDARKQLEVSNAALVRKGQTEPEFKTNKDNSLAAVGGLKGIVDQIKTKYEAVFEAYEKALYARQWSPFFSYTPSLRSCLSIGEAGLALSQQQRYCETSTTWFWLANVAGQTMGGLPPPARRGFGSEWHERLGISVGVQDFDFKSELEKAEYAGTNPYKIRLSDVQCGLTYQLPNHFEGFELGAFLRIRDPYKHTSVILRAGWQGKDVTVTGTKQGPFFEIGLSTATTQGSHKITTSGIPDY